MKNAICFILSFIFIISLQGQNNNSIGGKIVSDSSTQGLRDASVKLIRLKDSVTLKSNSTNYQGEFKFQGLPIGLYQLSISHVSFKDLQLQAEITQQQKEVFFRKIVLQSKWDTLQQVIIKVQKEAIQIRGDTTEFDAGSFKVRENAMVSQLLKKLPGINIRRDGTITAQGQKVTRVLVNGKPFFGDDAKVATNSLPAEIINKVQIIDSKENKRGEDVIDAQSEKIINLVIKEDKNKGLFGNAFAGKGTNDSYEASLNTNFFNNERRASIAIGSNNIGANSYGTNLLSEGGNTIIGIRKDSQVKGTYADNISKKMGIYANLGYNKSANTNEQRRSRQNFFNDSVISYNEQSFSSASQNYFDTDLGFDYNPDTSTTVRFSLRGISAINKSSSNSIFKSNSGFKTINSGDRTSIIESNTPGGETNFILTKKFKKRGRDLFINFYRTTNQNKGSDVNSSSNNYFANIATVEHLLQQANTNDKSIYTTSLIQYSEPLGKQSEINFHLRHNTTTSNSTRTFLDFDTTTLSYRPNDSLSNAIKNNNYQTSLTLDYKHNFTKGSFTVGSAFSKTNNTTNSISKNSFIKQEQNLLIPFFQLHLKDKGRSFNLNYSYNTNFPTHVQLQTVISNANRQYIYLGNPNLRNPITHQLGYNFNLYNAKKETSLYLHGSASATNNAISTHITLNEASGQQVSRLINVNGVYNTSGYISSTNPIHLLKQKIVWSNNLHYNFSKTVSFINDQKNNGNNFSTGINSSITIDVEDIGELSIGYNLTLQNSRYTIQSLSNNFFYTNEANAELHINAGGATEGNITWSMQKYSGDNVAFNQPVNIINADVQHYLNKKHSCWLTFKVYDLLKQSINISRLSFNNYIEDIQTNTLSRFFMLSLNVRLSKF